MRNVLLAAIAAVSGLIGAPASALTFFDNFDGYFATSQVPLAGGLGAVWTTTPTVDYLVPGSSFGELCMGTGACIDLDGTTSPTPTAGLLQTVQAFAAGSYALDLELFGSQRGSQESVTISLGSWSTTITLNSADVYAGGPILFSTSGGQLSFQNAGGDNIGLILSSVSLAAVPLPAGGLLLLAALGGLAGLRRSRGA